MVLVKITKILHVKDFHWKHFQVFGKIRPLKCKQPPASEYKHTTKIQ